jgi:hemerythrin-like domain-containing protein
MKAIDVLKHEHVLALRLLRCLGALAAEARILGSADRRAATALLSLLERLVDWSHQDKEELHLFPHMLARATPEEAERLARVFSDHVKERRRLAAMFLHLDGACLGKEASVDRFITHSLIYQRLQRKHVDAEEHFVLPLAEAILTAADDLRILRGFRQIDERFGSVRRPDEEAALICRRFDVEIDDEVAEAPAVPELIYA